MTALAREPEAEHDRDVREQRERVPVADRLTEPRDAIALGIERGNSLRDERPGERDPEHDGEDPADEPRAQLLSRPPANTIPTPRNAQYAIALLKASQLRSATIDQLIVTPIQTRQADECGHEHRARPPDPGSGSAPESDEHERDGEDRDSGAADREDPADVRPVPGEHGAEQQAADDQREEDGAGAERPARGLRPGFHAEPR